MQEILSKIGFNWELAVANLVNFLIIFWLLKRYAFGPIGRAIKNRQDKINQGLEDAQKAKSELMMAQQNYESTLAQARHEAQNILAKAHERAEAMAVKARTEAEEAATTILKEGRLRAEQERQRAEQDLSARVAEVAVDLTEKIIKEKVSLKSDKEFLKNILKN